MKSRKLDEAKIAQLWRAQKTRPKSVRKVWKQVGHGSYMGVRLVLVRLGLKRKR